MGITLGKRHTFEQDGEVYTYYQYRWFGRLYFCKKHLDYFQKKDHTCFDPANKDWNFYKINAAFWTHDYGKDA